MISRRAVAQKTAGVAAGTLTLVGQAGATRRGRRQDGTGGQADRSVTTVTATANRTAVRWARLPDNVAPLVATLESQLETVSIDQCSAVSGRGTVDGDRLRSGVAVLTGTFPAGAVRRECRTEGNRALGRQERDQFVIGDGITLAPTADALVVGYDAQRVDAAATRVDRAFESLESGAPSVTAQRTESRLASTLDGDAIVTATLGPETRRRLRDAATDTAGPLPAVVDAAAELGIAVTVHSSDRTSVTYGIVAAPNRLSTETVRSVIQAADTGSTTVDNVRLSRSGGTILVDAELPTERALDAQATAIGLDVSPDRRP